jgi:hypothetical protein
MRPVRVDDLKNSAPSPLWFRQRQSRVVLIAPWAVGLPPSSVTSRACQLSVEIPKRDAVRVRWKLVVLNLNGTVCSARVARCRLMIISKFSF